MKLNRAFYQLPFCFDANHLQEEIAQFQEADWHTHPTKFKSNSALALISVCGNINDDFAISGPMQPTPHLQRCPYLQQVLAAFNIPLSRARLMRIQDTRGVPPHIDVHYHWFQRIRIHIPIITHPSIVFHCGPHAIHMPAGTAWTFDNGRRHRVENPTGATRIHLVFDTKTSPDFWQQQISKLRPYQAGKKTSLYLEPYRFEVLTPEEITSLINTISQEKITPHINQQLDAFQLSWHQVFEQYGHSKSGELAYRQCIAEFEDLLPAPLRTQFTEKGTYALKTITTMLKTTNRSVAIQTRKRSTHIEIDIHAQYTIAPHVTLEANRLYTTSKNQNIKLTPKLTSIIQHFSKPKTPQQVYLNHPDKSNICLSEFNTIIKKLLTLKFLVEIIPHPKIERPLFIVSAPRAGGMILFETLSCSTNTWATQNGNWIDDTINISESDQLTEIQAKNVSIDSLMQNLVPNLYNAQSLPYTTRTVSQRPNSLRLLDYHLKNALRIPFLKTMFPSAQFIYIHRRSQESISSIIEGWRSGKFITRQHLPHWPLRRWSFPLPPKWQNLKPNSLAEIATFQWTTINALILDNLTHLSPSTWHAINYTDLIADPHTQIQKLCDFANITLNKSAQKIQSLPLSCRSLSAPSSDKWRKNEAEIRPILAKTEAVSIRLSTLSET